MQVKVYFDPDTFQHLLTVYTLELSQGVGRSVTEVRHFQNLYSIEERFSEFRAVDGLTLPTRYQLHYTEDVLNDAPATTGTLGGTRVYDWDMTAEQIQHNLNLDAKNFRVK